MSKNTKLQEEFESLIGELERLKSINEITSENTNNARKTIDEIASFVQSVNIFKTSVIEDYRSKKKDFEVIENSLNETLGTLNDNVEKQTKKFESLASNFTNESNKTLESVKGTLEEKIKNFTSEINTLKEKLETDITEFTKVTSKEIDNSSIKLNDLFILIKASLDKELTNLNKVSKDNQNEILRQFQILNNEIKTNKTIVKNLTIVIIAGVAIAIITFGFLLYRFI
jgi:gas vesicle protein